MSPTNGKHRQLLLASLLAIVLLGSSMLASNFSAYADKDSKNNDKKNNEQKENNNNKKKKQIKKALQSGKPVPKYKISGLDTTYLRLQRESEHQGKIQWTLDIIESFLKVKIGDPKRLHILKSRLEEGIEVGEKEISYLRENYKLLRKAIQQRNKMLEDIIKTL